MFLARSMICFLMVVPVLGFSQSTSNSILVIKSTQDFEMTADSSSAVWKTTPWVMLPYREGSKKYQTKLKLLYSTTGLYCLFYCEDEKIVSTMKNDFSDLWKEDVVEAFLWTDEATPLYFEYELSPHNVELPILVPNNKGNFLGWLPWHYEGDRKTRHAAHITPTSWIAEFFIPYALLKPLSNVPPTKGTRWRGNFYRIDYDEGSSEWSWQLTRTNFHDFEKFGTLLFD